MSNKLELQNNNIDLQGILTKVNTLPKKENIDEEVDTIENLTEQIKLALEGKAAGGEKVFAIISVTYPEGSTCTCSKDEKTLTLSDTEGEGFFLIPEEGIWKVFVTDGENNAEQDIEIIERGQIEELSLGYNLVLIKDGAYVGDFVFESAVGGVSPTIADGTGLKNLLTGAGGGGYITLPDISSYNTLYIDAAIQCTDWACMAISTDNKHYAYGGMSTNAPVFKSISSSAVATTYTLDISSLPAGQYYLKLTGYNVTFQIYNIWFENVERSSFYLFKSGEGAKVELSTSLEDSQCYVNIGSENIEKGWQSKNRTQAFSTAATLDLTNYNTLGIEYTCSDVGATNYNEAFGVSTAKVSTGTTASNLKTKSKVFTASTTKKIDTIDISDLTGSYYLGVCGAGKSTIYNFWLE